MSRYIKFAALVFALFCVVHAQHQVLLESYDAAEKLYGDEQYQRAYGLFSQVFMQSSDQDLRAKALYMKALCSYHTGAYQNAAQEFEDFIRIFPDHPLLHQAAQWAGNAFFLRESYLNSAQYYALAMLSPDPKEQRKIEQTMQNVLWGYLPTEYYPALLDRVDRSLEGYVGYWWLKRLQRDGEYARALREGQKLLQRIYVVQDKRRLEEELGKVESYLSEHLVVAVLVPQAGDFAGYGDDVRRGVELAFGQSSRKIEVRVIDSGGDALTTAREMDKLMRSTTPLCIIGPITSNETVAAGALAGTYRVPLITPSASRDGIAEISPYIFQLIASPVKAATYLAQYATALVNADSTAIDSVAILAPDNELGRACAMAFATAISDTGRTIVGAKFYATGTVDFSQMLAEIKEPILQYYDVGWRHFDTLDATLYKCDSDSGCRLKPREEWAVHIDAFFVPGYYSDIGVILPQIPFMYITTRVFGVNGWVVNDLRKEKNVKRYLDGCIIVPDDFYICRENEEWKSFERAYKNKYGASPSRLAALGYDAASLVLTGIARGAVTQELMRDFLSGIFDFNGAAGPITFDENGANTTANIFRFIGDEPVKMK